MFLSKRVRVAAAVAVAAGIFAAAPVSAAAPDQATHPLDTEQVDVATISLDEGAMRLAAEDGTQQPRDPESVLYTTTQDPAGVAVGWDTTGIDAGELYGDTVRLRLTSVEGPVAVAAEPLRLPVGERGATNWTFPEAGRYTLTLAVDANSLTGEPLRTEERYAVEVAPAQQPEAPTSTPAPPSEAPVVAKALPVAPLAAQPPPTTSGRVVLSEGHADAVAPRLLDGKLQIQVKDGTTVGQAGGQVHWREPGDVVFHAKPATKAALPADPVLAFLGQPGNEIFLLPQQQQAGILWTGWSTEELHASEVSGPVTWRLTKVDGPGAFGIFTTGSFGESTVLFNSADGLPDSHPVALGTHAHANWAFAKQGVYRLTVDVTATLTGGQQVADTEVYTFAVGDVDPNTATPGGNGVADPGAGGTTDNTPSGAGNLAYTGTGVVLPLTAGGIALIGLGGATIIASRWRRKAENS